VALWASIKIKSRQEGGSHSLARNCPVDVPAEAPIYRRVNGKSRKILSWGRRLRSRQRLEEFVKQSDQDRGEEPGYRAERRKQASQSCPPFDPRSPVRLARAVRALSAFGAHFSLVSDGNSLSHPKRQTKKVWVWLPLVSSADGVRWTQLL
jgi:hypothetical protein